MKLSHEVPKCMLEESRYFNDYDYALVHLFEEDKEYYNFFIKSLKMGRRVILDNSIFELGEAFDFKKYAKWVNKLHPTEYILPDVLGNSNSTMSNVDKFLSINGKKISKDIKVIGVVQGDTIKDMIDCYKFYSNHMEVDKIAIGFNNKPYYNELSILDTMEEKCMEGRMMFINQLINNGLINYNKPHHLLGCMLPQEFKNYKGKNYSFIDTIDTSSPIVHAIKGIKFGENGIYKKESIKMVDLYNIKRIDISNEILFNNIKMFRSYIEE